MKSTLTSLFLAAVFLLSSGSASVLYTRQTGPLPSFNDPLNAAGDDYIDQDDDFDADGVDIDVAGRNYNIFGTTIAHLRCFDNGFCECGTAALSTTIPADNLTPQTPAPSGLYLNGRCLIAPYVYAPDNNGISGNRYHLAYRQASDPRDIDRITETVNKALHQFTGTWTPTNAIIITWKVEQRANAAMSDHFQAVLTSSDDGTTYVIFLYGILTTIQLASGVYGRGFVTYDGSYFARVCPREMALMYGPALSNFAPGDSDLMQFSNFRCGSPGEYVFATKDATGECTQANALSACLSDPSDSNCVSGAAPQDTCTENHFCLINDPATTATLTLHMKWYKYARLQAINYAAFIGMGSEADPQGDQTFETGATCGADLPNPATAADFDTFSIDVTLATPECGFDVDEAAGTIKYAFRNYKGDGTGGPTDVNAQFEQAGDVIIYGTCYYKDLSASVTQMVEFHDFSAPTNVPPRVGRTLDFKIVDRADKTNAEEVLEAELGRLVYLQICFQPGTPFNLQTEPFGVWVKSCLASNDMTFPADNPASYERTVMIISAGCIVPAAIIGPVSLETSFVVDAGYSTPGGEWCINAGPMSLSRWNLVNTGAVVEKVFFQCVVEFCTIRNNTLCTNSCIPGPASRKRRSTTNPSETVYASLNITYKNEEPNCVKSSVAISTVTVLNGMLIVAVGICTLIFFKVRKVRKNYRTNTQTDRKSYKN